MSAKHGRNQRSPQPESAGPPDDTPRRTARERFASSTDLPKLRKDTGSARSLEQPRRAVVPLPGVRRSVAVVGRPLGTKELMSETRIGWIGTGVMGISMCGHLIDKGYPTTIYSRTKSRAQSLLEASPVLHGLASQAFVSHRVMIPAALREAVGAALEDQGGV